MYHQNHWNYLIYLVESIIRFHYRKIIYQLNILIDPFAQKTFESNGKSI